MYQEGRPEAQVEHSPACPGLLLGWEWILNKGWWVSEYRTPLLVNRAFQTDC